MEVIPRTLTANCSSDVVRTITGLRPKHAVVGGFMFGIDGLTRKIVSM